MKWTACSKTTNNQHYNHASAKHQTYL